MEMISQENFGYILKRIQDIYSKKDRFWLILLDTKKKRCGLKFLENSLKFGCSTHVVIMGYDLLYSIYNNLPLPSFVLGYLKYRLFDRSDKVYAYFLAPLDSILVKRNALESLNLFSKVLGHEAIHALLFRVNIKSSGRSIEKLSDVLEYGISYDDVLDYLKRGIRFPSFSSVLDELGWEAYYLELKEVRIGSKLLKPVEVYF